MKKTCYTCNIEKDISSFGIVKRNKDGYNNHCKKCMAKKREKYSESNIKRCKEWCDKNRDYKRKYEREYSKNHKEENKKRLEKYKENNRDYYYNTIKQWSINHKDEVKKYKKEWQQHRIDNDIKWKIHYRFSSLLRSSMKKYIIEKKDSSWIDLVGYTVEDLMKHFGINDIPKGYHIDHIIPVSLYRFKSYKDEDFKKCWNIRNLRLITAEENIKKKNKLCMDLIKEYGIEDLLPENILVEAREE